MRKWLKSIDWGPIVGAALVLTFLFSVVPTSSNRKSPSCPEGVRCDAPAEVSWPTWVNSDSITAASTTIIAIFTIVLVFVTNRQARLTRESIDLGNKEFIASHRPKIFVHTVAVTDKGKRTYTKGRVSSEPAKGIIRVVNAGDSPAFILGWQAVIYFQSEGAAFTPGLDISPRQSPHPIGAGISPGQWEHIGHTQIRPVDDDWDEFAHKGGRMFFIGRIIYQGTDEIVRNTGFCREYDPETDGAWKISPNSEYEYAY